MVYLLPLLLTGLVATSVNLRKSLPLFGEFKTFVVETTPSGPSAGSFFTYLQEAKGAEWQVSVLGSTRSVNSVEVRAFTRSYAGRSGMNALMARMTTELGGLCLGLTKAQQAEVRQAVGRALDSLEAEERGGPAASSSVMRRTIGPVTFVMGREGSGAASRSLGDSGDVSMPPEWLFSAYLYRDPKIKPWPQNCVW